MRTRTNAGNLPIGAGIALGALLLLVLSACLPEPSTGNGGRNRFNEIPTAASEPASSPTVSDVDATPQIVPEFVIRLLSPGPTFNAAERIYFRDGRDLILISGDDSTRVLSEETRFGPYATSPHGQRAAVVIISEVDGRLSERVHILVGESLGPALTPDRITTGPEAQSSIQSLAWSRDATRIAIIYDEAAIGVIEVIRPEGSGPSIDLKIRLPDSLDRVTNVDWAVTSTDMAVLAVDGAGRGSLWLASINGETYHLASASLNGTRSVSNIAWLPGRGRVAFVEERVSSSPAAGGSLFSVAPDGSGRELLVSSGTFAPAAEIIDVSPSPGGSYIAFNVAGPDATGVESFNSAWVHNIDAGTITQVTIPAQFRVTDFWWTTEGLLWRAVAGIRNPDSPYTGTGTFVLGSTDPDNGHSTIVYQAATD